MSSSIDLELELEQKSEQLNNESLALRDAAEILKNIRQEQEIRIQQNESLKRRVKDWLGIV